MSILECRGLTKEYYSGENVIRAVDDANLSFAQGEFTAVTGPSGSGKSTLLHLLSSLENPTSGEVIYNGESLKKYNDNQLSILRRRRFGFVFQAYNLVQELTGMENILLPVMLDKKKPDEGYIEKLTEVLGIGDRLAHLPSAMSGGQQQRIAIARALLNKPEVIIADEPTGNLDGETADGIMQLLSRINREEGTAIVMVTHNRDIVEQYPGRVFLCKDEACTAI